MDNQTNYNLCARLVSYHFLTRFATNIRLRLGNSTGGKRVQSSKISLSSSGGRTGDERVEDMMVGNKQRLSQMSRRYELAVVDSY
jgi:hypothetical protein